MFWLNPEHIFKNTILTLYLLTVYNNQHLIIVRYGLSIVFSRELY